MSKRTDDGPVLKCYNPDHLAKIALPLGGIGTETVSLGGRRKLKDWEVVTRFLEGPIDLSEYAGDFGSRTQSHRKTVYACVWAMCDCYNGRKRSSFDEAECDRHYARARISRPAVLALIGFPFDAVTGRLTLNPPAEGASLFFATGSKGGTPAQEGGALTLRMGSGPRLLHSIAPLVTLCARLRRPKRLRQANH